MCADGNGTQSGNSKAYFDEIDAKRNYCKKEGVAIETVKCLNNKRASDTVIGVRRRSLFYDRSN